MRVLRTLPLLLGLHFICTHGITAPVGNDRNLAGLRSSAPPLRDNEHGTSRQRPQHLTPSQSCKEEEAALDCKRLLASLARAGGVKGKDMFKGKEGGWLPDALQQFSAAKRVVAVNAVSWAAVVGGTVLWSRNKMISDGGAVRKALVGAVVSSSSVQVASNVLRAVSGNVDGANGGNDKEPSAGILGAGLKRLRWSYLGVLAVCYLGEHTRGAYSLKTISQHHDLKPEKMLNLQVATLTSSMITALFCGSFLDRYGRRYGCMLWAVLNILQSILIRSKAFFGVFLSSVIAGVGGALIRTAFEAWMVTEHRNRGYPSILLGDSFHMATWAMGLTPVASAFVAKVSVEKMKMGYLAPDNVAIGVSMMSLVLIGRFWKENFGERSFGGFQHTQRALSTIVNDSRLWMMGLVQTLFESSMFVFVFLWSTAPTEMGVTSTAAFSAMMISLCGGSSLFKLMARDLPLQFAFSSEACLVLATGASTLVFAASSMAVAPNKTDQTSTGKLLLTFLLYHACMGLYFPAMATCRSEYIGDRQRGTVMNILRVPMYLLSAIVVSPLGVRRLPKENLHASMFGILASFTGVATLVQVLLLQRENQRAVASSGPPSMALPSKEKRGREGTG